LEYWIHAFSVINIRPGKNIGSEEKRNKMFFIIGLFALLSGPSATAADWPQWRGPSQNGMSPDKNLPLKWSPTDNVIWKLKMKSWSGSTPIIWGDYIFLNMANAGERVVRVRGRQKGGQSHRRMVTEEDTSLAFWCVNRNTGEILWTRGMGDGNRQLRKQNMSSPSPVTDGNYVWAMTGTGILKGFDFSGNEIWSRDLQQDYGIFGLNWGYASSPVLYQDSLYLQVLHGMKTDDPSYILAIEKDTGRTLWRVERLTDALGESPDSYTTPVILNYGDSTELVISGGDYVTGHDLKTGEELWRAGNLNPTKASHYRIVASPLVSDGLIYVPSRKNPLQAFRVGGRGNITESHLVWSTTKGPDVPTPVSDGKYLYILGDRGVMSCLDARTGAEIWAEKRVKPGIYSASPVLADGKLYVTSEDGTTTVIRSGSKFEILAENDLESYTLSTPAISDGQIFIRTEDHLYCIGERASIGD
jgi:outer membrane protein assembly factor BamB